MALIRELLAYAKYRDSAFLRVQKLNDYGHISPKIMFEVLFLSDYTKDDPTLCHVGFMGESDSSI